MQGGLGFGILRGMENRKRYSRAEQELVIGLYRESGRTLREFCEGEGLEIGRMERWMRARERRDDAEVRFVEVEQKPPMSANRCSGKYRLGFSNGNCLEIEGGFDSAEVKVLVCILQGGKC